MNNNNNKFTRLHHTHMAVGKIVKDLVVPLFCHPIYSFIDEFMSYCHRCSHLMSLVVIPRSAKTLERCVGCCVLNLVKVKWFIISIEKGKHIHTQTHVRLIKKNSRKIHHSTGFLYIQIRHSTTVTLTHPPAWCIDCSFASIIC